MLLRTWINFLFRQKVLGSMTNGISYTFAEQDTDNLPSFAIEQVFSKLPSSNTYRTETGAADESLNFVQIASVEIESIP